MRPDAWSPRTWVLAAVAGWAVLLAGLGLFGLGSRIAPLPADPALVQALPRLPATPPERLGPLPQYAEIGARPLFSENRQPQPFYISGEGEAQAPGFDMVLSSVLITPRLQLAIVQPAQGGEGLRVKMGESPNGFPGWRLVELEPRRAVFDGPEGRRELELRVFDGSGGAPPTPMATGAPGAPPGTPPVLMPTPAPTGGTGPARATGGISPPMAVPAPTPAVPPQTTKPTLPKTGETPAATTNAPAMTTEQQMDAIRQRIEARRAQMRQQGQAPTTPPPATPGKTQ